MYSHDEDLKKNAEGYPDPTAYHAIKNIDKEDWRFNCVLHTIFNICELAGFKVEGRIVLKDKKSDKVWR